MIFIIYGLGCKEWASRMTSLFSSNSVRTMHDADDRVMQFVYDNFSDSSALTVITLHPNYKLEDALRWVAKYEHKLNVPVMVGEVHNLWR